MVRLLKDQRRLVSELDAGDDLRRVAALPAWALPLLPYRHRGQAGAPPGPAPPPP